MSNADKAKPGVEIVLAGETLTVVFDLWALVQVERKTGKTVPELLQTGSLEGVLVLLWASLQRYHELSEEEVGHMITMNDIPDLTVALGKALDNASPEGDKQKQEGEGKKE